MIPIVFWASLAPWLNEKSPADTSWRRLNTFSISAPGAFRKVQPMAAVSPRASTPPIRGESTMAMIGLTHPDRISAPRPALATPAPPKPPIRACDDELGRPRNQVIRFQTTAPIRAAIRTSGVTMEGSISPFEIVLATAVPTMKAARKLNPAAQMTATPGDSTRVLTTVAMELALSWNPLMKSNVSATTMMTRT